MNVKLVPRDIDAEDNALDPDRPSLLGLFARQAVELPETGDFLRGRGRATGDGHGSQQPADIRHEPPSWEAGAQNRMPQFCHVQFGGI